MKGTVFYKQAELLLRILPLIYKEDVFALKGGTAINFFVRDLPRLSVDIDLTYLPVNDRDFALNEIRLLCISGFGEVSTSSPAAIAASTNRSATTFARPCVRWTVGHFWR